MIRMSTHARMGRTWLCRIALGLGILAGISGARVLQARVAIRGRDVLLDGEPYLPHGMVHVGQDQFPAVRRIGINTVHVDLEFNRFDPRKSAAENRAAFQHCLEIADAATRNGLTVLWLFSFHYIPDWFYERYPDARMQQHDGSPGNGGWISMCLDHPGFREVAAAWLTFMAEMLGPHPATLAYVLWNEPHLTDSVCYHPHTVARFRDWLQDRYGTAAALNVAWQSEYEDVAAVVPPAPRGGTQWFRIYDKMVSADAGDRAAVAAEVGNQALWMDWMRFRQEHFAAFWKWEADTLRSADPGAVITSKIVPFDLYSSHAHGAGTNTELWMTECLDVLGMDLYPHLDEDFLARWKCDYFLSLAQGKPIWHTEFNFTFVKERGLAPPAQWRTAFYWQLARGVNGFWDFMWNDDIEYTLHYKGYKFAPVTHEIARISEQMRVLAPQLAGLRPAPAQVAVLHSTTTGLALCGDYAPTADQTTVLDLLYRNQVPFRFVTEDTIRNGALQDYRVLIAVGAVALPDDVVEAIRLFTVDNGGHVLANARFAAMDGFARPRPDPAIAWLGVARRRFRRRPRAKIGTLELRREARSVTDEPVDVHVALETWSSRPIRLESGVLTGSGTIHGDEDTQMAWSCGGRHELYWEDLEVTSEGRVTGRFEDGRPAIVETRQTVYVARDICWVDAAFERFVQGFLRRSGVHCRNDVVDARTGAPVPSVDLRAWEGDDGRRLLFVINSPPTLHYDGHPLEVNVRFNARGEVQDALSDAVVPSVWHDFRRQVPLRLEPGAVRVLRGRAYTPGWRGAQQQYDEVRAQFRPEPAPAVVWRRAPDEIWVYDNRTELGIGMHDVSKAQFQLARQLGIRLVRRTVYWYQIEKSSAPGVYDPDALADYDDIVDRAHRAGIELVLVVHGNVPGTGWSNRQESYRRFARFMGFLAGRYPSVRFWELWNEMDSTFTDLFGAGQPHLPNFERGRCYAEMLQRACPAIRKASPTAWVLAGGISSGGGMRDFVRGIYAAGGRDYFDFMNIHTYGVPVNWGMMLYAYQVRMTMAEYGDAQRPLWNTEFGIDAGNLWAAWQQKTGAEFDAGHLGQWRACIEEASGNRLYAKVMPYQMHTGNERARDAFDDPATGIELPEGHTQDDYGFGILRRDGVTPRPTYEWLLEAQVNRPILETPVRNLDVTVPWDGTWIPAAHEYETGSGKLTIRNVRIDTLAPTRVRLISPP